MNSSASQLSQDPGPDSSYLAGSGYDKMSQTLLLQKNHKISAVNTRVAEPDNFMSTRIRLYNLKDPDPRKFQRLTSN